MSRDTWELPELHRPGLRPARGDPHLHVRQRRNAKTGGRGLRAALDNYQDFLKTALENPDLRLFSEAAIGSTPSRRAPVIIFSMLISLFDRAYLLPTRTTCRQAARRWNSWRYIRRMVAGGWTSARSSQLLRGEDPTSCATCSASSTLRARSGTTRLGQGAPRRTIPRTAATNCARGMAPERVPGPGPSPSPRLSSRLCASMACRSLPPVSRRSLMVAKLRGSDV